MNLDREMAGALGLPLDSIQLDDPLDVAYRYAHEQRAKLADAVRALADELDTEAREHAVKADAYPVGSKERSNLMSRALGKKVAAVRMREIAR